MSSTSHIPNPWHPNPRRGDPPRRAVPAPPPEPPPPARPPVPIPTTLAPPPHGPLLSPATDPVPDRLLDERVVYLGGELDDAAADRVITRLVLLAATEPRRDITLYLRVPGGSASAAMAVYDTLVTVAPDVATCAVGLVGSVGQFLLTAGAAGKRSALPHARILLRRPTAGGAPADVGDQLRAEIVELVARHSGQPVDAVARDAAAGRWFTAAEAVAYGLVDRVG